MIKKMLHVILVVSAAVGAVAVILAAISPTVEGTIFHGVVGVGLLVWSAWTYRELN